MAALPKGAIEKLLREVVGDDVPISKETIDWVTECAGEFLELLGQEANTVAESAAKKENYRISHDHNLGMQQYANEIKQLQGSVELETQKKLPFGLSPVAMAFMKTFKREITIVLGNCILYILALSMQSYVVQAVLQFLAGEENLFHVESGYWLLVIMTVASILAVGSLNYAFFVSSRTGANMRSLVMDLVYQKSLRLSCVARQEYSTGEVLTLMSVDTERVFMVMQESPWIIVGPVSFVISVILVGFLFDVASAAGGAVTLIVISMVSVQFGNTIARVQHDLLAVIEQRVKVTSESLQGIRVMKFYAWEESLAQRVEKIRAKEITLL
ncbi:Canalicular multispecific organic anion transporter, partial [Phytophthora palmivora]